MLHLANHHCHTVFSDGKTGPEDYVRQAIEENMISVGFSDHAPFTPHLQGNMSENQLDNYFQTIENLKVQYSGQVQIYRSLEVDYIPGVIQPASPWLQRVQPDYIIGAVHYIDQFSDGNFWGFESGHENFNRAVQEIFAGDVKSAIQRYYELISEMISTSRPDVVAHLDRIKKLNRGNLYFDETELWYRKMVIQTLEKIAATSCIMEINTKGYYSGETDDTYPSHWILEIANELSIPVHLASDAHHPENLRNGFDFALKQLRKIGYKETRVFIHGEWQNASLLENRMYIY